MRLREAGVPQPTIRDLLWHASSSTTHHSTLAQIVAWHGDLEKIKQDSGRWQKSLATPRQEQEARRRELAGDASPPQSHPPKKNGLDAESI